MVNKPYKVGAIIKRQAEDPRFFETLLSSSALKDWKDATLEDIYFVSFRKVGNGPHGSLLHSCERCAKLE
jgi:hypothetical protein